MSEPFRLGSGGHVDRSRPLEFRFDGERYRGLAGDTLASALLANGIHLVGRSFKYHRARGILTAGPEEPNALVELREGACREPNARATMVELFDGLVARSQNRWPSLAFDIMALNQLFSPILVAGFYYKTFMWPPAFWERLYEPMIRRAAGLGHAATLPDPDTYEHGHLHCDVLVAGGGPAGLMAALAAARGGARVVLADENARMGGALLRDEESIDGEPAARWLERTTAELDGMPEVRRMSRTTVFGYYDHNTLAMCERLADHLVIPPSHGARQRMWTVRAKEVVLATGCHERPLVFGDNDTPGIMLSTAVRRYLLDYGVAVGRKVAVAGNNDDIYRTAMALKQADVEVAVVADARVAASPCAEEAKAAGIEVRQGLVPRRGVKRSRRLVAVELGDVEGGTFDSIACDALAVSGGFNPAVHLASQSGARPRWDESLQSFVPGTPVQHERSAGAALGIMDLAGCLEDGARAGTEAAQAAGFSAQGITIPDVRPREQAPIRAVWSIPGSGAAFIDPQNDVTLKDVRLAHQEGMGAVEHAKRWTTLGMATDQGKISNVNGLAILASLRGQSIPETGITTFRPPYTPVAIGNFAGHERGKTFQPMRRTAMHEWHEENGAVFVEAGQWLRPRYYPRTGSETLMEAAAREAEAVRRSVGLCDVSTLGRIEIFGPDSAEFLNRLYINGWSKLAVGKARYGLMLREDGHVFDDGTTSRLAQDHFLMTTTTANAARVLAHMEHYSQVVWPELDVVFCTATEQWAGMALAGPKSRDVLAAVVDAEVSNEALPFMGVVDTACEGTFVRVFRISFSGELAYELNTPWGYGKALWERCIEAGRAHDITPYGSEALAILRIEKGHAAGQELDGRTTAQDLGMGRMMSSKKHFIGLPMSQRPGMKDEARPSFVGIKPVDPQGRLRGGAHLVEDPEQASLETSLGWLSSVHWSPAMGTWIGLGFVRGGLEQRRGRGLSAYYPLKGETVPVEITEPVFVDPEGERLRA